MRSCASTVLAGVLCLSSLAFARDAPTPHIPEKNQPLVEKFIEDGKSAWWQDELRFLTPPPQCEGSNGWRVARLKEEGEYRIKVCKHPDPYGEENNLFYYWDDLEIDLPLEVAGRMYSSWLELGKQWMTPLVDSQKLMTTQTNGYDVWFQYYLPKHAPRFVARQLLVTCPMKELTQSDLAQIPDNDINGRRALLISCRNIPRNVSNLQNSSGERINLRGGYLLIESENPGKTHIRKLDRENQGGNLNALLMNHLMPGYLIEEVEMAIKFIDAHRSELIERADKT